MTDRDAAPPTRPLSLPAILFAHRGARAHAPENTLEAFRLAVRLGATGLESDVWRTATAQRCWTTTGVVGGMFRRRRIAEVERADLPEHIPTLDELYEACGADHDLSLDVKDADAVDAVLEVAASAGALREAVAVPSGPGRPGRVARAQRRRPTGALDPGRSDGAGSGAPRRPAA